MATGGVADRVRDDSMAHLPDGVGNGPNDRPGNTTLPFRQGFNVQLPREPSGLRRGGLGHASAWRLGLFAPQAVRTHLSPSPALQNYRGIGRNPDSERR